VEQAFVGKVPRAADHHVFRHDKPFTQVHKCCRNSIVNQLSFAAGRVTRR
jgi:hypothetical protein